MSSRRRGDTEDSNRESSRQVSALSDLWPFIRRYKLLLFCALIALFTTAAISLVLPIAVRRIIDTFRGGDSTLLNVYFLAAIGIAALLALATGLRYALVSKLGERVVADIRVAVFERVIGMSPAFYDKIMTGEVLSRLTTDTTVILSVIGSTMSLALRNILICVGGLLLMLLTSAKLTGLVILLVPVIVVPIIFLGRRLRGLSRANQDWIAASSGAASEELLSAQTVQAFTHEPESARNFAKITEKSYTSALNRIQMRALLTVIVIFLIFTGVVGVLWIGARDVRLEVMSIGTLIQFLVYAVLVAGAVGSLSEVWGELQRAAGATERLVELLNISDPVVDKDHPLVLPQPVRGEIRFENVTFSYPARPEAKALNGLNLHITPGETVAFVGPSGAGKTTIIQLLERFYDPQQGRVLLDEMPLDELSRDAFRKSIALVPQDPVMFGGTVAENIRFGRLDATQAEIIEAATAADAHKFIMTLPERYDSRIGERGMRLSGGQKQRIALARAILRNASVLLLDEATSALDAESERAVQEAVELLAQDRTTLIIAHRLATVKKADRIIVMDEGRIVAEGTHDQLVAEGGLYTRLARLQFTEGEQSNRDFPPSPEPERQYI